MVCPSSSLILVLDASGERRPFDPAKLQGEIVQACLAAGVDQFWLAEDLVYAVEGALELKAEEGILFSEPEILSWAAKAMEDVGYPEVAACLRRRTGGVRVDQLEFTSEALASLYEKNLGISGSILENVLSKAMTTLSAMGAVRGSTSLALEVGRHMKSELDDGKGVIPAVPPIGLGYGGPWIFTSREILALAPPDARLAIDSGVLGVGPVSRLFPALKIDIRLVKFAEKAGLEPPITELAFLPRFMVMVESARVLVENVRKSYNAKTGAGGCDGGELPVQVRIVDLRLFVTRKMNAAEAGAERLEAALMESLASCMTFDARLR